jgi:hypothetical protein
MTRSGYLRRPRSKGSVRETEEKGVPSFDPYRQIILVNLVTSQLIA